MTRKVQRKLEIIAVELEAAIKNEGNCVIAIGRLLLEAKAQVDHGEWIPWLVDNFDLSTSTAENYMNAGRLALKFPTVGNLRLRASALYLLGSEALDAELFTRKAIKAVLKEAESKWVSASRAYDIADALAPKPEPGGAWDSEAEEREFREQHEAAERERREEQEEAERLLDDPPDNPPSPDQSTPDIITPPFNEAVTTLGRLVTKPLAKFVAVSATPDDLRKIGTWLVEVADAIEKQKTPEPAE